MNYNFDIFISYNRKDENFVEFLIEVFNKYDIKCFLDKSELKLYDKLDSNLKKNVANSRFLLSLISPGYLNSYWCLFEAIEAIQGQSLDLKFLPIFLRYTETDPLFNEDYVLERLAELNTEIESFEIKMIKNKAYELSSKIEKLNFIKTNLPKIFNQSHINIYPVFDLFNQQSVLNNLEKLVNYIKPEAHAVFNSVELTFNPKINYQYSKPSLNTLPQIRWSVNVGIVKWKNVPIILGNDVFIGTSGKIKNTADEADGVYCINFQTGKVNWFTATSSDVNELTYLNGSLIFGCIDGAVYNISAKDGAIKWRLELDAAVFAKPFVIHDTFLLEQIFFVSYTGSIFLANIHDGSIVNSWSIDHNTRSNVLITTEARTKFADGQYMYFSTEDGFIFKIYHDFIDKQLKMVWGREYKYPDKFSETGYSQCSFYASPTEYKGYIIQPFVRQTYYDYPAIFSIDKLDGSINWLASDAEKIHGGSGNLRTQPLVINDDILFTDTYSNSIVSLNGENGVVKWSINAGRRSFEQWSSPVYYKEYIFLARHEGHLNKIDLKQKKKEWSMYLGDHKDAGVVIDTDDHNLEKEQVWWDLKKGHPIYSTPVINKNHLLIGTDEGLLYCISNII